MIKCGLGRARLLVSNYTNIVGATHGVPENRMTGESLRPEDILQAASKACYVDILSNADSKTFLLSM